MTIFTSEDFEAGTVGQPVTATGTAFDYVRNGPTYVVGLVGDVGMRCARTTAGDQYAQVPFTARSTLYLRMYVRRVSTGIVNDVARVLNSAAQITGVLRVTAAGAVQMRTGSTNLGTASTATIPTTGAARIEWAITPTTMQARMFVGTNVHGSTPDWDSGPVTFTPLAAFDRAHVGIVSNANGVEIILDDVALGDDWPGPSQTPPPPHRPWRVITTTGVAPLVPHVVTTGLRADRIAYLGDSLTRQDTDGSPKVNASLGTLGWDTNHRRVDGHVGRPIIGTNQLTAAAQSSEAVVAAWRAENWRPAVWVVALGANNIFNSQASWTADMNGLLDLIAVDGHARVYIVGQVFQLASENPGSTYAGTEGTMQARWDAIAAARTDLDVHPVDLHGMWRAHFAGGSEAGYWTGGDGRHMTSAGYDLRNQLIGSVIDAEAPTP